MMVSLPLLEEGAEVEPASPPSSASFGSGAAGGSGGSGDGAAAQGMEWQVVCRPQAQQAQAPTAFHLLVREMVTVHGESALPPRSDGSDDHGVVGRFGPPILPHPHPGQ